MTNFRNYSNEGIVRYIKDSFKEITGIEYKEIFNYNPEIEGIFNDETIINTEDKIIEIIKTLFNKEQNEINEILFLMNNKFAEDYEDYKEKHKEEMQNKPEEPKEKKVVLRVLDDEDKEYIYGTYLVDEKNIDEIIETIEFFYSYYKENREDLELEYDNAYEYVKRMILSDLEEIKERETYI